MSAQRPNKVFPNVNIMNGYQLLVQRTAEKRTPINYFDNKLFPCQGPDLKSLIEISGPPSCGKSHLLWHIMARAILPSYCSGKNTNVLFLNLANKFNVRNFHKKLEQMVRTSITRKITADECEQIVEQCLDSVNTFQCYSLTDIDRSFDEMEDVLLNDENISLLVVDSLDAFYWVEATKNPIRMFMYYKKWIAKLKKYCREQNICCAYTVDDRLFSKLSKTEQKRIRIPVNYLLEVNVTSDGKRMVNKHSFTINNYGLHFV